MTAFPDAKDAVRALLLLALRATMLAAAAEGAITAAAAAAGFPLLAWAPPPVGLGLCLPLPLRPLPFGLPLLPLPFFLTLSSSPASSPPRMPTPVLSPKVIDFENDLQISGCMIPKRLTFGSSANCSSNLSMASPLQFGSSSPKTSSGVMCVCGGGDLVSNLLSL